MTVAAVQALVHVRDQFVWGVSPANCIHEIMLGHAAVLASAVANKAIGRDALQGRLGDLELSLESASFVELVRRCFVVGYELKWEGRFED